VAKKNPFGYGSFKKPKGVNGVAPVGGGVKGEMSRPLPLHRRFRPPLNTKAESVTSEYNYASLYARWRRGYELAMYAQQAYDGLTYSFRYYITAPNVGQFLPGMCFMYPTTKTDMRMYMVGVRPRDSFNFLDFGFAIESVTDYDSETIAVKINTNFGAPISFFTGEVVSNRYNADGTEKTEDYQNYTVVAVGRDGVQLPPSPFPIFNTLFLAVTKDLSWTVVNSSTLTAPARENPAVGEYLTTEMRYACSCPDYLSRRNANLYEYGTKEFYPYTKPINMRPGIYDAGDVGSDRFVNAPDDPGYVRDFGFIYLNSIYNIASSSEASYTNLYFHQPRWCKHIYAAMWDMQLRFSQGEMTQPWLVQPNDEPLDPYYREHLEKEVRKQSDFLYRNKNLVWWERYSPARDNMPAHMMMPDMYNMMVKVLNFGASGNFATPIASGNFIMTDVGEYNPFDPASAPNIIYDGGTYENGAATSSGVVFVFDGGQYQNGALIPPSGFPSFINGGTY
jgi:hypothetical protein